uniref:Metalloendopeptidase n=1 Tax=Steinernema glaseri TaxID=37863 RepID=A0A1I7ZMN3_9BILA
MRFLVPILVVVVVSATMTKRAATNRDNFPERLFPTDRPITYSFSPDFATDDRLVMDVVLRDIASMTCLSFEDLSFNISDGSFEKPLLMFENSTKCGFENVEKLSDSSPLRIYFAESTCRTLLAYYRAMLYALGMFETQLRPDRDEYISVHEEDIQTNKLNLFKKYSDFFATTYGVPYDFESILHAIPGTHQRTKGIPTLVAKDPLYQPGMGMNRITPSHSDFLLLNRLYRCLDKCATSEVKCQNGGFLNPNNCTKCICPRAFRGDSCNEMNYACGGYRQSTTKWRRLSVDWSSTIEPTVCHWFLTAPPGRKIEIELENIVPEDTLCPYRPYTWLEVKLGNFAVGGYKFFCNAHIPNHTLISEGNLTVLTLAKDFFEYIEFELLYRNVEANS